MFCFAFYFAVYRVPQDQHQEKKKNKNTTTKKQTKNPPHGPRKSDKAVRNWVLHFKKCVG